MDSLDSAIKAYETKNGKVENPNDLDWWITIAPGEFHNIVGTKGLLEAMKEFAGDRELRFYGERIEEKNSYEFCIDGVTYIVWYRGGV